MSYGLVNKVWTLLEWLDLRHTTLYKTFNDKYLHKLTTIDVNTFNLNSYFFVIVSFPGSTADTSQASRVCSWQMCVILLALCGSI